MIGASDSFATSSQLPHERSFLAIRLKAVETWGGGCEGGINLLANATAPPTVDNCFDLEIELLRVRTVVFGPRSLFISNHS